MAFVPSEYKTLVEKKLSQLMQASALSKSSLISKRISMLKIQSWYQCQQQKEQAAVQGVEPKREWERLGPFERIWLHNKACLFI